MLHHAVSQMTSEQRQIWDHHVLYSRSHGTQPWTQLSSSQQTTLLWDRNILHVKDRIAEWKTWTTQWLFLDSRDAFYCLDFKATFLNHSVKRVIAWIIIIMFLITYRFHYGWQTPLCAKQSFTVEASLLVDVSVQNIHSDHAGVHWIGILLHSSLGYHFPRMAVKTRPQK